MKERLLNILKWFFIVLGVLFFIQLLLMSGIFIGINSLRTSDIKPIEIKTPNVKLKEIQPIIDYVENYRQENHKYPDKIDIKIKKGEYEYSTSENSNCFKVIYKNKKSQKEYNCCKLNSDNSTSKSESYSEITK